MVGLPFGSVVVVVGATVVVVVVGSGTVVGGTVDGGTVVVVVSGTVVVVVVVVVSGAVVVVVVVVVSGTVVVVSTISVDAANVAGATVVVGSFLPPPSQPGVFESAPFPPPQFAFKTSIVLVPEPAWKLRVAETLAVTAQFPFLRAVTTPSLLIVQVFAGLADHVKAPSLPSFEAVTVIGAPTTICAGAVTTTLIGFAVIVNFARTYVIS